ncbi:MAG TPA: hypothetical protein VOA87_01745 [Thermoanaerobaculia bacterium]|nr:hypothetical protein [Thermoanaerobaculia bacterium]
MGLFDTIHCEYPLPDARHQGLEFQTKDLDCALDEYTITADGRLLRHVRRGGQESDRRVEWPLHGDVSIYTHVAGEDPSWIEYVVRFTHDRVEWIRPIEEVRPKGRRDTEEQATAEAYAQDPDSPGAEFDPAVWEGRGAPDKR